MSEIIMVLASKADVIDILMQLWNKKVGYHLKLWCASVTQSV